MIHRTTPALSERNWNSVTANKMSNPRQYRRQTAKMSNWQTKATRRPGCRLTAKDFQILSNMPNTIQELIPRSSDRRVRQGK